MKEQDLINEATLESRIHNVLKTAFPTFKEVKLEHQKTFSFKLGHHNVQINHKDPSRYAQRAILDILLTIEDENCILLELKAEGQNITDADVSQGISYARLIHPMPPITILSNSDKNLFFNSYTKEELDATSLDVARIQSITNNVSKLAKSDLKDALHTILNKDYQLFSQVLNGLTSAKFDSYFGSIYELDKTLCSSFSVKREIIRDIQDLFDNATQLVGIKGAAYSGKTTLLYQYFKDREHKDFCLYLDCYDLNYSIFQQLANAFSAVTKITVTKDNIREWLLNSLSCYEEGDFVLLIDNFNKEVDSVILNEIIELIDIFNSNQGHCIYTIDEYNFDRLVKIPHKKYRTIIGRKSKTIPLQEFTDSEYNEALQLLFDNHKIGIQHGGHYTIDYRQPRILRYIASHFDNDVPEGSYFQINAVPDLEHLKIFANNKIITTSVHQLYKKLALTFFEDEERRKSNPELSIMASGSGAVSKKSFNKLYNKDYNALIESSSTVMRKLPSGLEVIYPKVPELVAYHSIKPIARKIIKLEKKGKSIEEICKLLTSSTYSLPYCDLVATGVLLEIGTEENIALFSNIVERLLTSPPVAHKINKGTKTLMYVDDIGHIQMNFEDDFEDGDMISNFLPFIILSQLSGYVMGLTNPGQYSLYAFHITLLYTLASSEHILIRPDARTLKNMKHIASYDWDNIGKLICGTEGIVEPLVQSIYSCFFRIPDEIEALYERAFQEDNFTVLWRIHLAIRSLEDHPNKVIASRVKLFNDRFMPYAKTFIAKYLSKSSDDFDEKKIAETLNINIKNL